MKITKESGFIAGNGASTAFFVLVLLYTMSVFFFAFASGSSFLGVYGGLMGHPGGGGGLAGGSGMWQVVLMLISLVPSMLICAGLWLLCFAFRNNSGGAINHLLWIRGAVTAQFILIFALIAVVEAALFVNLDFVTIGSYPLADRLAGGMSQLVTGILLFALPAAAALLAVYFVNILRAAGMVIRTLRTGERRGFIPMPLIIMNCCFSLLNLVNTGLNVSRGYAAAAAASICMAAFLLGMAAVLNAVRRGS